MKITDLKGTVKLANGVEMPYFGLGVFKTNEGTEVENSVKWALESGYRHIDTAAIYQNERGVGNAVKASGIPRNELFITTKAWNENQRRGTIMEGFEESLELLQTEYVDLYLIHWPVKGKYTATWKVMEEIYLSGRAKAIGLSNFLQHHLEDIFKIAEIRPMVNQVECHPYLVQQPLIDFCQSRNIVYEAWRPIMQGMVNDIPLFIELSEKYKKMPVHIVLRWDLQKGIVTIPKSVHKDRIEHNANIFDFELSAEDIHRIDALDRNERFGSHPDTFDF
ncbi:MAG: aldo/keto reductase [Bacteroidia bacterium]|nr:aldo/keto reductase [Bacteroidia bacterium]